LRTVGAFVENPREGRDARILSAVAARIYLDHVASTPLDPVVAQAMDHARSAALGNPSSLHLEGRRSRDLLEGARERVAKVLSCRPREVLFTAGGTESCDLALRGAALGRKEKGRGVAVSAIEHAAVLDPAAALERDGFDVARVPPTPDGTIDPAAFDRACGPGTTTASVMAANHETGALLPVRAIADLVRARGVCLHCDAALGPGLLDVRPDVLGVDLLSSSAHKWNGPKGVGFLYVRRRTRLEPVRRGGIQEERLRPGTEDVVGAVGLATALERADAAREDRASRGAALSRRLEAAVLAIEGCAVLGPRDGRLPGVVCVETDGCEGESLLVNLDLEGIAASTGSACAVGAADPSPVLTAMGLTKKRAASTIRFSFGEGVEPADVDRAAEALARLVERLRSLAR
jgi:cysteine desulfurase